MNNIISKILCIAVILGILPCGAVSAENEEMTDKAVAVVCGLGIMDNAEGEDFYADGRLTRGETAKIIAGLFMQSQDPNDEWNSMYFRDESAELGEIDLKNRNFSVKFDDVDEENEYYPYVMKVYEMGVMRGVSDTSFGVNSFVTGEQVQKLLVHLLGYSYEAELCGGFPKGYVSVAQELGLTGTVNHEITRKEVAEELYRAFDVEIKQVNFADGEINISARDGDTFLNKILKLERVTGRMTDNGYSGLSSPDYSVRGTVAVDGDIYVSDADAEYACEYLGREVELYHQKNDNTMVFVTPTGDDEIVTFEREDFIDYNKNEIKYDDGKREKRIKLDDGCTYMIKNGTGKASYTIDDFMFDEGSVSVVRAKGKSTADVIYVNEHRSVMVDCTDDENMYVYGNKKANEKLDLGTDSARHIVIYDKNGKRTDFSAIKANMLITVSESERAVYVYLKSEILSDFKVLGMEEDEGKITVKGADKTFEISAEYAGREDFLKPKTGRMYNFYLNAFSKIAYIENASQGYHFGVLIKPLKDDEDETQLSLRFYSEEKKIETAELAERVRFITTGTEGETIEKNCKTTESGESNRLYMSLSGYNGYKSASEINGGLFRYKLNDEGKMTYIELPGTQKVLDNQDDRFVRIYEGNTAAYYKPGQGFGGRVIVDSETVVFKVNPTEIPSADAFSVRDSNVFLNDKTYNNAKNGYVTSYTSAKDSAHAEYVLFEAEEETSVQPTDSSFAVAEKVVYGLDDDDNGCYVIKCKIKGRTPAKYYADEDVFNSIVNMQGENTYKENGTAKKFTLSAGDVFRYTEDNRGYLTNIFLMYDADAENPDSGKCGNIPGSVGKWAPDTEGTYKHVNPMAIDDTNAVIVQKSLVMDNSTGRLRFTACSAYKMFLGKYLTTTTCDLKAFGAEKAFSSDEYRTDSWLVRNVVIVEKHRKGITVNEGTVGDIKTYENMGADCDKVLVISVYQEPISFVVYKGF